MPGGSRLLRRGHRSDGGLDFYQRRQMNIVSLSAASPQQLEHFPVVRLMQSRRACTLGCSGAPPCRVGTKHQTKGSDEFALRLNERRALVLSQSPMAGIAMLALYEGRRI